MIEEQEARATDKIVGGYTRINQAGNPPAQNPAGAPTAQGATVQPGNPSPANVQPANTLASSALVNVIPVIKEPKEADIVMKFKYKQLEKNDGKPTYPKLVKLRRQMTRNARAVNSPFGEENMDMKASSCGTQHTHNVQLCCL